jgi:hypothetical protein
MHDVKALVAQFAVFEGVSSRFPAIVMCTLAQGFVLVPISRPLEKQLLALAPEKTDSLVPDMLPGVATLAAELSAHGPVAYVSTEFFGGAGGQGAVVWDKGNFVFTRTDSTDKTLAWPNSPVSQALRAIGVIAAEGKDEFDTVGLGKHRSTERWSAAFAPDNVSK